jgi:stage II sporulation protein R
MGSRPCWYQETENEIGRGLVVMNRQTQKVMMYIFISCLVLMVSWEYQRAAQASVISELGGIPNNSLRLRILAHSDSVQDQWLKDQVRDELVTQIDEWVTGLEGIEEAREQVRSALPEIERLVEQTIAAKGFTYPVTVEFGQIPFPAKLYGQQLYPAGEYEGLLVTIGAGQGSNWWCVLFPPLCFVDFGTSEATERSEEETVAVQDDAGALDRQQEDIEVRFFLLELVHKVIAWFTA